MNILQVQFLRFLIVGAINTFFGFSVFSALALTELPTWMVLLVSNFIGTLFNFVTTGAIVFKDLDSKKLPRFIIFYIGTYLLYLFSIDLLEPIIGGRILAMAVIVIPMTLLNYLLLKFLIFSKE